MSALLDALQARDKATLGPWHRCTCGKCELVWGKDSICVHDMPDGADCETPQGEEAYANCDIIAAAPEALAWIAKAIPLFIDAKSCIEIFIGKGTETVKQIDALLGQVTPREAEE